MRQIVLMYHDVYCRNKSESGFQNPRTYVYMISDQTFESHLRMITEWRRSKRIPPQKILFSFDDGGGSGFTTIAPLLEKYDYKGIFFIATKYIGEQGFLTRSQIKELYDRGHLIGSHSHSHPVRLTSLSREEIDCEWEKSQRVLESILGFRPSVASIPNGYVSPYVLTSLAKVGICRVFTSEPTTRMAQRDGVQVYGRYVIKAGDSPRKVKKIVSSRGVRWRLLIRSTLLELAKSILGDSYIKVRRFLIKQ